MELCCAPETESEIFRLGPRAGAADALPRVRCASALRVTHTRARAGGADLRWQRMAEDALAVQDALGLRGGFGVGHSLGGAALLLAEATRPGSFRALYLFEPVVAPSAHGAEPHPWDAPLAPKVQAALQRRRTFPSRQAVRAARAQLGCYCLFCIVTN